MNMRRTYTIAIAILLTVSVVIYLVTGFLHKEIRDYSVEQIEKIFSEELNLEEGVGYRTTTVHSGYTQVTRVGTAADGIYCTFFVYHDEPSARAAFTEYYNQLIRNEMQIPNIRGVLKNDLGYVAFDGTCKSYFGYQQFLFIEGHNMHGGIYYSGNMVAIVFTMLTTADPAAVDRILDAFKFPSVR